MIEFPHKKLLKRFTQADVPEDPDNASLIEKKAWDFGREAREGLKTTGLIEWFGISVRKARRVKYTWDVWMESWDHVTGSINVSEKIRKKKERNNE